MRISPNPVTCNKTGKAIFDAYSNYIFLLIACILLNIEAYIFTWLLITTAAQSKA